MLSKKFRLPIQEFTRKKGKMRKSPHFSLHIFRTDKDYSRFGVIISKKVAKEATKRNNLKRQLFDFTQQKRKDLPIADYLIISYPGSAQLDKTKLNKNLTLLFRA